MYKSIPINVPTAPHSPTSTPTLHPSPGDPEHTVITMKTRIAIRDKNPHLFQVIPLRDARLPNDQDATKSSPGWLTTRLKDASNAKKPSVTREFTSTSPKKASQSQREQLLALGLTPSNENLPALLHGVKTSWGQNKTPACLDSKPHRDAESSRSLINGKYLTNDDCQLGSVLVPPTAGAGLLASGGFCLSHLAASGLQQGVSGELETSSPGVPACLVQKPTTAILFHDPVVIPHHCIRIRLLPLHKPNIKMFSHLNVGQTWT
ncbi:hypothetical protein BD779DRAFT_352480 [Infundibulicybe gibba]|nr:hypothetical protein BD779DRAFT_352480 [Infundibulicybe gibba]